MIRKALLLAAALLCAGGLRAQYRSGAALQDLEDSDAVRSLKAHVGMIASAQMEGRKAGSEGEKMAAQYIADEFIAMGLDLLPDQEFGLARPAAEASNAAEASKAAEASNAAEVPASSASNADTLRSRNVAAFLPGYSKEARYIVIGARLDNLGTDSLTVDGVRQGRIYSGANGNASGLAIMLELARKLSLNRSLVRRNVVFVAFGASRESLAGSWYFLHRSFPEPDAIDAMINLDMLGSGSASLLAYTSSNEDMNLIVNRLRDELLPCQASLTTAEPYPGDHRVFYDARIPSVLLTTGRYPTHDTARDTADLLDYEGMERIGEYAYALALSLGNGPRPLFRSDDAPRQQQPGVIAFSDVDIKPSFLNSQDPRTFLSRWVYPYLKYPAYAQDNDIQGRVLVDFIVDESGNVTDARVSRGVHPSLDEEALRVVSASPKWRPGRHRGKKVRVAMTVAVEFRLERKGSFGINGKKL